MFVNKIMFNVMCGTVLEEHYFIPRITTVINIKMYTTWHLVNIVLKKRIVEGERKRQ